MAAEILLVIPCYRERERLPRFLPRLCEAMVRAGLSVEVKVVDDGSGEDQRQWLRFYVDDLRKRFPLLRPAQLNEVNQGKGGAIYSGWRGESEVAWLGFVDADGAISAEEVVRGCQFVVQEASREAVFGVRTGEAGTTVRRTFKRRISGLIFRKWTRRLFDFPIRDTQCGFKFVRRTAYEKIQAHLQECRFVFDVEFTFRLLESGARIETLPISWEESPGSRLGPKSVLQMARSLLALKRRLGRWQ